MSSRRSIGVAFIASSIAATILFSGCTLVKPSTTRRTELVFGTPCTVTVFERGADDAIEAVFEEMLRLDRMMNVHDESSLVSELNRRAGGDSFSVTDEVYRVIEAGIAFGQITGGAFDISIGPLVELWNIKAESPRPPIDSELEQVTRLVEYSDVLLLDYRRQVLLKRTGMRLDLGGIAKGYAADRAAELLRSAGVKRALIDFGGNIVAVGEKQGGEPWRIGIQNPTEPRGNFLGILSVKNLSVVTSGVYERFFVHEGETYHHILDPQTGRPVSNGLTGVTVVASSSMTADALATAIFVLGVEAGLTLIENFEGIEAVFVTDAKELYFSSGALERFVPTDESFIIVPSPGSSRFD